MNDQPDIDDLRRQAQSGDSQAQLALGRRRVAGARFDPDALLEGLEWLEKAGAAGQVEAHLLLGDLHVQYTTLAHAADRAARHYIEAARMGHPEAVERVADLYLTGFGVDADDAKALSIYRQLCGYGFTHSLCQTAYMIGEGVGCDPDPVASSDLYLKAAAQDCRVAWKILARRLETGYGMPQDLDLAEGMRAQAAGESPPESAAALAAFERLGDYRSRWQARLAELQAARGEHPEWPRLCAEAAESLWSELEIGALSPSAERRGAEPGAGPDHRIEPVVRSWAPRVFTVDRFASTEECLLLIDAAAPLLEGTDSEASSRRLEIDAFDGDCAYFGPQYTTPIIRNIQRRWAALLRIPQTHFEPLSVLRYREGREYTRHVDYFDAARMDDHRAVWDFGGQRIITALICLRAPDRGGETRYSESGLKVGGRQGRALIHHNVTPNGLADPLSVHEGLPIEAGEKWLARTAVRESPLFGQRFREI